MARDDLRIKSLPGTQEPTLYAINALPKLAFDHQKIIEYARSRLKAKIQYTNAVYSLLPEAFTFHQLQQVYEAIDGRQRIAPHFQGDMPRWGTLYRTDAQGNISASDAR